MKTNKIRGILFFILITISVFSCKKEEYFTPACDGSTPAYNSGIKAIIDANCMGSFCHGSGEKRGDFTSYAGLKPVLDNGAFKKRVIDEQDMPKGKGNTLAQQEINIIQCWINNGYPEN